MRALAQIVTRRKCLRYDPPCVKERRPFLALYFSREGASKQILGGQIDKKYLSAGRDDYFTEPSYSNERYDSASHKPLDGFQNAFDTK